jgi:hypothetical protein
MATDIVAAAAIVLFFLEHAYGLVRRIVLDGVDARARAAAAPALLPLPAEAPIAAIEADNNSGRAIGGWLFMLGAVLVLGVVLVRPDAHFFNLFSVATNTWRSHTVASVSVPVRYKWLYLGAGASRDSLVPVVECAHWETADTLLLDQDAGGLVEPLPEVLPDDRIDPARERVVLDQRARIADARATARRRCALDTPTTPTVPNAVPLDLNMEHLLTRARLSDWMTDVYRGNLTRTRVEHVLVQRNGRRWYAVVAIVPVATAPGQGQPKTASKVNYELRRALLDETALLETANAYVETLMLKSRGGIKLDNKCLCLAHFGVFGSGLHLVYDDRAQPPRWRLWAQMRYVRPSGSGAGALARLDDSARGVSAATAAPRLVESNMTYFEYLLQFPAEVDMRMQVINSRHYEAEYVSALDIVTRLETVGVADTHLDAREPGWVNDQLPPEHVPDLAAVIALDALFPRTSPLRDMMRLLGPRDVMCWAHCRDLEIAIVGANPFAGNVQ